MRTWTTALLLLLGACAGPGAPARAPLADAPKPGAAVSLEAPASIGRGEVLSATLVLDAGVEHLALESRVGETAARWEVRGPLAVGATVPVRVEVPHATDARHVVLTVRAGEGDAARDRVFTVPIAGAPPAAPMGTLQTAPDGRRLRSVPASRHP